MSNYFDNKTCFLSPQVEQHGGHMVMTNVTKPLKQKYINIDTRFVNDYGTNKTSYNLTSQFVFTLPEKITEVKNIQVMNVQLPISFYNISSSLGNNVFKVTQTSPSSSSNVVVLKDGFYSSATSLKTEINNETTVFYPNLTFDICSNSFSSLKATSSSYVVDFAVDTSGNYDKNVFRSKLGWMIGFRDASLNLVSNTISSNSLVDLNPLRYLYLVVDEFSNGFTNSFVSPLGTYILNKKILARICIDTQIHPFGSVLNATIFNGLLVSDVRSYNGVVDIQKLNVQLVNEWGVPVNLNGLDFSFVLGIEHL